MSRSPEDHRHISVVVWPYIHNENGDPELMGMFKEDMGRVAARDRHELLRCWELMHRTWVGEAHLRHLLHRKETRWPGFYYRSDYPEMDEANWRVFVNSRYNPENGQWDVFTKPCLRLFD